MQEGPPKGYWKKKIERNIRRDKAVNRALRREGWKVIEILGTHLHKQPERCAQRVASRLASRQQKSREELKYQQ